MTRRGGSARQRGQATVEVALALPVVVLALLLVIQVALVARAQVLVVHAAREGARAAAVGAGGDDARRAVQATPGLRPARTRVQVDGAGRPGESVRVTVSYRAPTDVPLVGLLLGDPTLLAEVTMRNEDLPSH